MSDQYQYHVTIKVTSYGKGDEEFEETGYSSCENTFAVSAETAQEAGKLAHKTIERMNEADDPTPADGIFFRREIISIILGRRID